MMICHANTEGDSKPSRRAVLVESLCELKNALIRMKETVASDNVCSADLFTSVIFFQPKKKPPPSEWKQLDVSPLYKNDNTLREYQLEGLNWLMFSWYNG